MSFLVQVMLPASFARLTATLRWPILSLCSMRIIVVRNGKLLCAGHNKGERGLDFDKASRFSQVAPVPLDAQGWLAVGQMLFSSLNFFYILHVNSFAN